MPAVVGAEGVFYPCCKTRSLVIEEESSELYRWFTIGKRAAGNVCLLMLFYRSVCPPVPWRNAQLTTEFVDTIDGASLVAAGHNNLIAYSGNDKLLTLALQLLKHELVYLLVLANSTHDNRGISSILRELRLVAKHHKHIVLQVACSNLHALPLLFTVTDGSIGYRHSAIALFKTYELLCRLHRNGTDKSNQHYYFPFHCLDLSF